jgi:hypothetical protein
VNKQRPPSEPSCPVCGRNCLLLVNAPAPKGAADLLYRIVLVIISPHFGWPVVVRLATLLVAMAVAARILIDPTQLREMLLWLTASPGHWITSGVLSAGIASAGYGTRAVRRKSRARLAAGEHPPPGPESTSG